MSSGFDPNSVRKVISVEAPQDGRRVADIHPTLQTKIEVRFIVEGGSRTRVEFEHRRLERYG